MGILRDYVLRRASAGLLLLVIGLCCATFVVANLARDVSLWAFGRRARAVVVETWVEPIDGESGFRYFVRYQFRTADGQMITRKTSIAAQEWASLGLGGSVEVVYLPLYPAHNRLDDSRLVPVLACAYLPLVFLSGAGLAWGWSLSEPIRARVLRRGPSPAVGSVYWEDGGGRQRRRMRRVGTPVRRVDTPVVRDGFRQGASGGCDRRSDPVRAAPEHGSDSAFSTGVATD